MAGLRVFIIYIGIEATGSSWETNPGRRADRAIYNILRSGFDYSQASWYIERRFRLNGSDPWDFIFATRLEKHWPETIKAWNHLTFFVFYLTCCRHSSLPRTATPSRLTSYTFSRWFYSLHLSVALSFHPTPLLIFSLSLSSTARAALCFSLTAAPFSFYFAPGSPGLLHIRKFPSPPYSLLFYCVRTLRISSPNWDAEIYCLWFGWMRCIISTRGMLDLQVMSWEMLIYTVILNVFVNGIMMYLWGK